MGISIIWLSRKHCGKRAKLLVTSNFFFSHYVFKSCLLLMCSNEYPWSKGWNNARMRISLLDKVDKRAMMALDRSPESFSLQMNSTSLFLWFQLVTLGVGPVLIPRGIMWIKLTKVYKEMLHTENLSSISSSLREEEFWSWSLFLCSNLWPQGWDQFWPQRNHMNKIDKGPQRDDKYQISKL